MTSGQLRAECGVFTRYLLGIPCSEYVADKYVLAHEQRAALSSLSPFDARLLRIARRGPRRTRLVDAYLVRRRPTSPIRVKLVILLAILETCPPYCDALERGAPGGWETVPRLMMRASFAVLISLVALLLFTPLELTTSDWEAR